MIYTIAHYYVTQKNIIDTKHTTDIGVLALI